MNLQNANGRLLRRCCHANRVVYPASMIAWYSMGFYGASAQDRHGLKSLSAKDVFAFSPWVYRQRNLVERFFNRLKHYRGIATRYDKNPANFLAAVKLIAVRIWCISL